MSRAPYEIVPIYPRSDGTAGGYVIVRTDGPRAGPVIELREPDPNSDYHPTPKAICALLNDAWHDGAAGRT